MKIEIALQQNCDQSVTDWWSKRSSTRNWRVREWRLTSNESAYSNREPTSTIRDILLQRLIPLVRKPFFCNRAYTITKIALDWQVYHVGNGRWTAWGTHDDAPQLSHAASRHNGLTVLENVFHILDKPWRRISFTLRCSMHSCKENEFSGP